VKRKAKVVKKRQKTILVPLPLPLPLPSPSMLLSPVTPAEPISADEVNEDEDENTKELVEVEDEDIDSLPSPSPPSPSPPPPARFISVWKAVTSSKNKSLPGIKLAVFNTKNIYYFKLDLWQNETVQRLLLWKFKITQLQAVASYKKGWRADCCP